MRKNALAILLAAALCLAFLALALARMQASDDTTPGRRDLTITLFDVGKADAILVQSPSGAVMIDAGTDDMGFPLVEKLRALGVDSLDALIITHFDKDHVGGADAILGAMPVHQVIEPDYLKDSKQYREYAEAVRRAGIEPTRLNADRIAALAGLDIMFITAQSAYDMDDDNNRSLVVRFEYGDTSFLFTGDIENKRLGEMLERGDLRSDFLKAPHHGGMEKRSEAFFRAVSAKVAVITSSDAEPEDADVVRLLAECGGEVYLTREGDITVTSDGSLLRVTQNNTKEFALSALPVLQIT